MSPEVVINLENGRIIPVSLSSDRRYRAKSTGVDFDRGVGDPAMLLIPNLPNNP